jgi:hypothetical protein
VHTTIVLAIGFGLLVLCALAGRALGGSAGIATGVLVFLPVWWVGAGINMYLGVKGAGYSVANEAPIFVLVFSVPAAAALIVWGSLR